METRKFRPLSDREKFTLETLVLYTDKKVSFALIGDSTAVTLAGVKPTDGKKHLRMKTREAVYETLHAENLPTDEGILDNCFGFVTLGRAAAITDKMLSEEELDKGSMRLWRKGLLNADIRAQCEMFELIAVAFAD